MRNNVNSIWTEALIADLIRLWDQSYSCAQIGAIIGVSRNAVIGKAHRLDLPDHTRSNNINGQKRAVNPKPLAGARSRTRETVFRSRERKPSNKIINKPATPGLIAKVATLTGNIISVPGFRRERAPEMTKDQLRSMLAAAVQNTAAMQSELAYPLQGMEP